jgi:uncharacterized protein YbaR (Trm112 family)
MNHNLIDLLVCPLCKGQLHHDKSNQRLICRFDRLAFAVRDGVPIMLIDQAEPIDLDDLNTPTSPHVNTSDSSEQNNLSS